MKTAHYSFNLPVHIFSTFCDFCNALPVPVCVGRALNTFLIFDIFDIMYGSVEDDQLLVDTWHYDLQL